MLHHQQQQQLHDHKSQSIVMDGSQDADVIHRLDDGSGLITGGLAPIIDESDDDIVKCSNHQCANFRARIKYLICDGKTKECEKNF